MGLISVGAETGGVYGVIPGLGKREKGWTSPNLWAFLFLPVLSLGVEVQGHHTALLSSCLSCSPPGLGSSPWERCKGPLCPGWAASFTSGAARGAPGWSELPKGLVVA